MNHIENVILVNEQDEQIGTMEKMEAHIKGKLHRAFSIFIFNSKGELLLQQRALEKYHSGGKWTNTCCSHPRPGEQTIDAAYRRLQEEMGMQCFLNPVFHFTYCSKVEPGIFEYEFDHVFFGRSDSLPELNLNEAMDYRYLTLQSLQNELMAHPKSYTEWLKICFSRISEAYSGSISTNLRNVSTEDCK